MEIAPTAIMSKEFRSPAGLHREALNSNTPAFQFLCYYKILEGIKKRRQRLIAEAKAAGAEIPKPPLQIVPSDQADFLPWLGDEDTLEHDVIPGGFYCEVPLRRSPLKQTQCFMVFLKRPIYGVPRKI